MSKYDGISNRLKNYPPLYILRTLYFSMVGPALNYGLLTWGYACSRLTKIQKIIIRTITCSKYDAHTEPLLKALYILKIEDTLKLNVLKLTKYADITLRNHLPALVNVAPLYILQNITTHSIYGFSPSVKQYHVNMYMYRVDCSIPNCYVCHQ